MSDSETLKLLTRFIDAWNAHDVDTLVDCMTEDGVFHASAGPAPFGTTAAGRDALRQAYASIWQVFPDARWTEGRHFIAGDRAFSEWIFKGTRTDGTTVEVQGCDLFTLRDGRIAVKNSFRKQAAP